MDRAYWYQSVWAYGLLLGIGVVFSLWSPFFSFSYEGIRDAIEGTPKYWFDEASAVDSARALWELGKLDIVVEPNSVSGQPYYANSPGFPVTVPLAGIFSLFGVSVFVVRLYALLWMAATLVVIFRFVRLVFGGEQAFWATLLVLTFAPFYANGKTIVGTLPGAAFLIVALEAFYVRKAYAWGGFWASVALATKPSMFLLIAPVFFVEFLWNERDGILRKLGYAVCGALPLVIVWLYIMFPQLFSEGAWRDALSVYGSHYPDPSLLSRLPQDGWNVLFSSTPLYMGTLFFTICFAWYANIFGEDISKRIWRFTILYAGVAVYYFLLSPGWFRYLLVLELLTFMLIPISLQIIGSWRHVVLGGLVLIQIIVFIQFSEIRSSLDVPRLASYVNETLMYGNQKTVGIINVEQLGALIPSARKFQIVDCGGPCEFGVHPLSVSPDRLPDYLIVPVRSVGAVRPYEGVLSAHYNASPEKKFSTYIYTKKTP